MQKKKIVYIVLGCVLAILVVANYLYIYNNLSSEDLIPTNHSFTIVADSYDSKGIDVNTGFIITSKEDFSLQL